MYVYTYSLYTYVGNHTVCTCIQRLTRLVDRTKLYASTYTYVHAINYLTSTSDKYRLSRGVNEIHTYIRSKVSKDVTFSAKTH